MDTHDPAPACPGAITCTSEPIYHELLDRWRTRGLTLPGTTTPVPGLLTYGDGAAPGLVAARRPGPAGTPTTEPPAPAGSLGAQSAERPSSAGGREPAQEPKPAEERAPAEP
ncbi:hypothetical protein OG871_03635 [Kitasatospora sp. NBC_00374]|uniref:hypothetical protein n=1 Tax=Kitasatospora sp. NBC_00374 TaxID=2975964 RepID=UPI0032508DF6